MKGITSTMSRNSIGNISYPNVVPRGTLDTLDTRGTL